VICPGQSASDGTLSGQPPDTTVASFHIHGLSSRWVTWGERTHELVRLKHLGDEGRLQSYINTEMGECYWPQGEAPEWQEVMQLSVGAGYRLRQVPEQVQRVNVAVDVQKNRLVCTAVGWSKNAGKLEAWLLDYSELYGNTAEDEVWEELKSTYLFNGFGDGHWTAYEMAVDSGFNPTGSRTNSSNVNRNIIYDFCADNHKVVPIKGASRQLTRPFRHSKIEYNPRGKPKKRGMSLYEIDTDFMKREIYTRLKWPTDKPGRWHFPEFDHQPLREKFFQELCSEQLTEEGRWLQVAENHVLDTFVMHLFLAEKQQLRTTLADQQPAIKIRTEASAPSPAARASARQVQSQAPSDW